jgi:3,2-trans-enoyl-CoA isomerase
LILSSSLSSIFSAGLDLTELYQPDPVRLPQFWKSFQQVYLDLYGSRLATIAAMNGHAPAAGCMLALSCDYRIMSAGSIGLNESKLGIVAPPWLGQQYIDTIGHRQAELALSLGTLFNPQEALGIGLVDEVVADNVVEAAKQKAVEWVRIPPQARSAVKELTRGRQIERLLANRDQDIEHFCSFVSHEKVQRNLGQYLEQMAKRKKKN